MQNKTLNMSEWFYLTLSVCLTAGISLILAKSIISIPKNLLCQFKNNHLNCHNKLISFGEKRLIPTDIEKKITNKSNRIKFHNFKQEGIELFSNKAPANAAEKLENAFNIYHEPETLIYKNNAHSESHSHIQIAVSVPISKNLEIAEEILRGVAQAQDEINQSDNHINGKWLQIGIADDKNDPRFAKEKIAPEVVSNTNILAVVGHNASNVSQAVAEVYEQGKLVMVSPTSYSMNIANYNYNYNSIFKVVPDVNILANALQEFYIKRHPNKHLFICYDSTEYVSQSFKSYFFTSKVNIVSDDDDCNVSSNNFQPATAISQAKNKNADSLLLAASSQKTDSFIQLAKLANQSDIKMALFSSSSLYTPKTLVEGQEAVKDMVLVSPWHPDAFQKNPFFCKAQKLWQEKVNWRTAMAYDATKVIIEGLKRNTNRQELALELHNTSFSVSGATGKISFKSSGERQQRQAFIIKVVEDSHTDTGYDFALIDPIAKNNSGQSCNNQ
ncbi:MAG: amino acid ABC transporter substrate-binding protein [Stigonema ocellatum SAG 48.90 = DSM 106950]|nr:amino acid ABC transporter substrate-binding protein [Stigonema ocellatum SAG 48.90 = DSM 106950]